MIDAVAVFQLILGSESGGKLGFGKFVCFKRELRVGQAVVGIFGEGRNLQWLTAHQRYLLWRDFKDSDFADFGDEDGRVEHLPPTLLKAAADGGEKEGNQQRRDQDGETKKDRAEIREPNGRIE